MADEELLTVAEVARRLKLHPETVRRWIKTGRLHAISLGSDRAGWRIRASEVELLLQGGQRTQPLQPRAEGDDQKRAAA
jgi:excisionase family DNA binding protein